jgi:hypothetical protein
MEDRSRAQDWVNCFGSEKGSSQLSALSFLEPNASCHPERSLLFARSAKSNKSKDPDSKGLRMLVRLFPANHYEANRNKESVTPVALPEILRLRRTIRERIARLRSG